MARYRAAGFCDGYNLGSAQAARALDTLDRRPVAWIYAHHITEEQLDGAIQHVINAYNRFALPLLGVRAPRCGRWHEVGPVRAKPAVGLPHSLRRLWRDWLLSCQSLKQR